jgi:hypothetical protein
MCKSFINSKYKKYQIKNICKLNESDRETIGIWVYFRYPDPIANLLLLMGPLMLLAVFGVADFAKVAGIPSKTCVPALPVTMDIASSLSLCDWHPMQWVLVRRPCLFPRLCCCWCPFCF